MESQALVVLVTVPSEEVGQMIARELVKAKLAACVNILPAMSSIYSWQGEIHDDEELLLLIKTRPELFDNRLVPAIKALHPYEVPEIIALPVVKGSQAYLDWIREVT